MESPFFSFLFFPFRFYKFFIFYFFFISLQGFICIFVNFYFSERKEKTQIHAYENHFHSLQILGSQFMDMVTSIFNCLPSFMFFIIDECCHDVVTIYVVFFFHWFKLFKMIGSTTDRSSKKTEKLHKMRLKQKVYVGFEVYILKRNYIFNHFFTYFFLQESLCILLQSNFCGSSHLPFMKQTEHDLCFL